MLIKKCLKINNKNLKVFYCGRSVKGVYCSNPAKKSQAELFPGRVDQRVGSGRVGSGRVRNMDKNGGSGRVGSRPWRVGSGPSTLTRPDPPCFSKPVTLTLTVIHNQLCVNYSQ